MFTWLALGALCKIFVYRVPTTAIRETYFRSDPKSQASLGCAAIMGSD